MSLYAYSYNVDKDPYCVMRALFEEAQLNSVSMEERRWQLDSTRTEPKIIIFTAYQNIETHDWIGCESRDYDESTGKYKTHKFVFHRGGAV